MVGESFLAGSCFIFKLRFMFLEMRRRSRKSRISSFEILKFIRKLEIEREKRAKGINIVVTCVEMMRQVQGNGWKNTHFSFNTNFLNHRRFKSNV